MTRVSAVGRMLAVVSLSALFFVVVATQSEPARAIVPGTTPLTSGNLTMVSTHADGTSGLPVSGIEGANQVAVSDDGSAVAFVSDVPAQDLVTDPVQLARGVSDNNTAVGTTNKGDDVFLYQKLPGPQNPIISLVSENVTGTGTGNAPSDRPVMAPHGLGLVFQSSATDMVSGHVDANQNHIYAWVSGLSSLTGVYLIDTKNQSSDACSCAATNPSLSLTGPLGPTVVFEATGGGSNDLVDSAVLGQGSNQIYAHSIITNTNTLVSVTNNTTVPNARSGTDPDVGNGAVGGASEPLVASDAPIVVFTATGDDLVKDFDSSNGSNIWERNLLTDTTTLVSVSASGDPNGTSGNDSPVISNFGTSVSWQSNSNDVSSTPFPPAQQGQPLNHVYFRIVLPVAQPTTMVDTDWTGALACDTSSGSAGVSGDGRSVVFDSQCSDITTPSALGGTTPDSNADTDVFERTFAPVPDAAPKLLSVNDAGDGTGNGGSLLCAPDDGNFSAPCADHTNPSVGISFDGTVVTYFTTASDVAAPAQGTPPFNDGSVIVSYPQTVGGVTNILASHRADGAYAEDTAGDAVVSKDGSSVAFVSAADNLVPNDTNDYFDVYEADLHNTFFISPITPVDEGAGMVTIAVGRTGNNGTSDQVTVATGDGLDAAIAPNPFPDATEAFQPGDYTETEKTLDFPPGTAVQTFDVPIVDDTDVEGPEIFHVSLSPSSTGGAGLPGPASDAYVEILDNDAPPQDWSATVTSVPASAHVGDTVTVKTTITVDSGANDLTVTSLQAGAATSGLDQVTFADSTPFNVSAGTTKVVTATARVTAAPGTAGVALETSVDGSLGAVTATRTALSNPIGVTEAVSASLTGAPAHVGLADQMTYTLTLTNNSDTTATQLDAPDAGFAVPTGTSLVSRTSGSAALAPGASTDYTLTVGIDDADADGTAVIEAPAGVTYGMSDISLPTRAVAVTPEMSTVDAPVVAVGPHTITDHDGGTLLAGDTVDISVTVANSGHADTAATLDDALSSLSSPTDIKLDGSPCGTCSSDATSVTATLSPLGQSDSHVLTFSATVGNSAVAGDVVTSSATVTFAPATTGTSPTATDEQALTVGSDNVQGWTLSISGEPPVQAAVGDTVQAKATISVTPGPDDLSVTDLSSGAGTSGLDQVSFDDNAPFTVGAGGSEQVTVTARVVAAPGTGGVQLEVSATGSLGAAPADTKTADTDVIQSGEAVAAVLTGAPATVTTADQVTYTLSLTNSSDTAAQITGFPAALAAPVGTTAVSPASGSTMVAAHGSTDWTLTVDVDDADTDGTVLTESPGAVSYAMSAVGLPARTVALTPPSVTSTVTVPDTTPPGVTINQASTQADPTSTAPIDFTVVFNESVTGFDASDIDLGASTAGGTLTSIVTGGPTTYTVGVSGMTTTGNVIASIPAGAAFDAASNPSNASTSGDNSVGWAEVIASSVGVTTSPSATVYGQAVTATATVGVVSGTASGTVQFDVDGVDAGSPVTVSAGLATSGDLGALEPGSRVVGATFAPTDPLTLHGSSGSTNLVVSRAATSTSLSLASHALHVHVSANAPGAGEPGGSVTFSVDGQPVGTAPVSAGAATLTFTTSAGKTRHVAAVYSGDGHFTASSAATVRHNPSITAHVSSGHAKTKYGWYRSAVTVSFTCATHGAPLVGSCPAAVTRNHDGADQVVSRTIAASNGGIATATSHVNIDTHAPHVSVTDVTNGGRYLRPGPTPHCSATDALSGVATCHLTRHTSGSTVHYSGTATDKAGNARTIHGSYRLTGVTLSGTPFSNGAYTVHRKTTYLVVVTSVTRPTYVDAAPSPQPPFHPDAFPMRSAGHHRWAVPVTMTTSLRSHRYWNIGVQIGWTLQVVRLRVLP